jgi:valyl-tRNA synthetase
VRQDEDVLDTWFSSWLWPFSTLGWPDTSAKDFRAFYPTDVLVSGPDILFFWIARMIMAGYFFVGGHPFHTVYLHGIVRDTQHRKMSKSLGNGIDPLDVVRLYGADALRYTVIAGMGLGVDIILDPANLEQSFGPGRNFTTKLWNIARFILSNVEGDTATPLAEIPRERLTRADAWILARLDAAIAECDAALGPSRPDAGERWSEGGRRQGLRLNDYAETARRFVWNELADWYVETTKGRFQQPGADREVARAVLVHAFDGALRLLHPIVPYVTEALWQRLPQERADPRALLATASWPSRAEHDWAGASDFALVIETVTALRQLRAEYAVPPGTTVRAVVVPSSGGARRVLADETALIGRLARAEVAIAERAPTETAAHALLSDGTTLVLPLGDAIDVDRECGRLRGELTSLEKQLEALQKRLENPGFVTRAPEHVVAGERQKAAEWGARRERLREKVTALCGG